jgi:hypothetical protein
LKRATTMQWRNANDQLPPVSVKRVVARNS